MKSLWSHFLTIVRRTTQPYEIQVRTIVGFNLFLTVLLLLLIGSRYLLLQECPDISALSAGGRSIVRVAAACPESAWRSQFVISIIDNLVAALIVALVTSWLIWLMSPRSQINEDIAALAPWNIRPSLLSPLPETRRYHYRGRSGRFLRSKVIPELFKAGQESATRREVLLLLPDPADSGVLSEYAHYRNSLASEEHDWDVDRIRIEIVATVIFAAFKSNSNQFFECSIYLKSDFSLLRMDMSDDRLILTREDESWPAIICSRQSKFYASYEEEFHMEARNGVKLPLDKANLPKGFDSSFINPALMALGIKITLTDEQCEEVIQAINNPKLPYV